MVQVNQMFSDLLNQAPPLRLSGKQSATDNSEWDAKQMRAQYSEEDFDVDQMTSIDLQKEVF